METSIFRDTDCAICGGNAKYDEVYGGNFEIEALNPKVFSARRLPDRIHYRMVKCKECGLVRSNPIVETSVLEDLYKKSTFTYDDEVANIRKTYGYYLKLLERYGVSKGSLLEIGCGNGFFLEEALRQGYSTVKGVEPSLSAIEKASLSVREHIQCGMMAPGLFPPNQFDVICLFQVFDHLPNPASIVAECFRVLKPGGLLLALNHNVESWSARLLGERSPIIDIEHTYLFSPHTMKKLFSNYGFEITKVGAAFNRYRVNYLARLFPLGERLKVKALSLLKWSRLGNLEFSLPIGNLYLVAKKEA